MNPQQLLLGLTFNELGMPLSVESFDERLIAQKVTSIVQEAGIPLGYFFNWYVRGPYCSSVAEDVYAITSQDEEEDELSHYRLGDKTKSMLQKIKPLFKKLPCDVKAKARTLELWASILFLQRTKQVNVTKTPSLQKILKANGKHFQDDEVEEAIKKLRVNSFGL